MDFWRAQKRLQMKVGVPELQGPQNQRRRAPLSQLEASKSRQVVLLTPALPPVATPSKILI